MSALPSPLLCVECAHFNTGTCERLRLKGYTDPVWGTWVFSRCDPTFQRWFPWLCGKKGRYFVPEVHP